MSLRFLTSSMVYNLAQNQINELLRSCTAITDDMDISEFNTVYPLICDQTFEYIRSMIKQDGNAIAHKQLYDRLFTNLAAIFNIVTGSKKQIEPNYLISCFNRRVIPVYLKDQKEPGELATGNIEEIYVKTDATIYFTIAGIFANKEPKQVKSSKLPGINLGSMV